MVQRHETNPKVDAWVAEATAWRNEVKRLRAIALDAGLTEEWKWRAPCYTAHGGNIVIIQTFKAYCALLFFKGALLSDPEGILQKTGEHTRVGRQARFTSVEEIAEREAALKACIREAIEVEVAGLKVEPKTEPEPVPEELQARLDERPELKTAFEALTPGRRRAYILHVSRAKQSKTRRARVERAIPRILDGKGLNDP